MGKHKIGEFFKKILIILMCVITLGFSMPKKANADVIQDFISLILKIPDGVMAILNWAASGSYGIEKSWIKINLKGVSSATKGYIYNFDVTPYDIFTSGQKYTEATSRDGSQRSDELIKLPILDINFFRTDDNANKKEEKKEKEVDHGNNVYLDSRGAYVVTNKTYNVGDKIVSTDQRSGSGEKEYWVVIKDYGDSIEVGADGDNDGVYDGDSSTIYLKEQKKKTRKSTSIVDVIKPVISNVYKSLRNFVLIAMLVVLVYIGIRIVTATAVTDQVKYKQWIVDWVVGICLVLGMHYIMSFFMSANQMLIDTLCTDNNGLNYYISLASLGAGEGESDWNDLSKKADESDSDYQQDVEAFYLEHLDVASGATEEDKANEENRGDPKSYHFKYLDNGQMKIERKDWNDGQIFVDARIYKDKKDDEDLNEMRDKAVYACNIVEFCRTLTSFGSKYETIYTQKLDGDIDKSKITDAESTEDAKGWSMYYGFVILYIILVIETLMFFYKYLKRVITIAFYTMIAPLIALMYPLDKLGDGQAQAFNTWFKEYLFNVLIQPLHLLIYTIFISAAGELITKNMLYAIICYAYMISAENFFKKIFGFDKAPGKGPGMLGSPLAGNMITRGAERALGLKPPGMPSGSGGKGGNAQSRSEKIKNLKTKPGNSPTSAGMPSSSGTSSKTPNSSGGSGGGGMMPGAGPTPPKRIGRLGKSN